MNTRRQHEHEHQTEPLRIEPRETPGAGDETPALETPVLGVLRAHTLTPGAPERRAVEMGSAGVGSANGLG